jgi:hypothetical protein
MNRLVTALLAAALVAGCQSVPAPSGRPSAPATGPATAPSVTPAGPGVTSSGQPRYNLAGYSAAFKQGYMDACTAERRRDEGRFQSDTDYRLGWTDGTSICRRK